MRIQKMISKAKCLMFIRILPTSIIRNVWSREEWGEFVSLLILWHSTGYKMAGKPRVHAEQANVSGYTHGKNPDWACIDISRHNAHLLVIFKRRIIIQKATARYRLIQCYLDSLKSSINCSLFCFSVFAQWKKFWQSCGWTIRRYKELFIRKSCVGRNSAATAKELSKRHWLYIRETFMRSKINVKPRFLGNTNKIVKMVVSS